MLIASNRNISEWSPRTATPSLRPPFSRLLHHSHVITIRGDSYWPRAIQRSGLLPLRLPASDVTT